jgi:hypothetical protein
MSIFYLQLFDKINPVSISKDHFPKQGKTLQKITRITTINNIIVISNFLDMFVRLISS